MVAGAWSKADIATNKSLDVAGIQVNPFPVSNGVFYDKV